MTNLLVFLLFLTGAALLVFACAVRPGSAGGRRVDALRAELFEAGFIATAMLCVLATTAGLGEPSSLTGNSRLWQMIFGLMMPALGTAVLLIRVAVFAWRREWTSLRAMLTVGLYAGFFVVLCTDRVAAIYGWTGVRSAPVRYTAGTLLLVAAVASLAGSIAQLTRERAQQHEA